MWWKILIGFFVLRSVSQPAPAAQSRPSGVMPMLNNPITSPMAPDQPAFTFNNSGPMITSPMAQQPAFTFSNNGPMITSPPMMQPPLQGDTLVMRMPITTPLFDNTGPQKIMQPVPALGGSAGYEF